tara:strand:- start:6462 stop:6740 length:279 start_codon:yes stop_codon:yes gene_type:complete
MEIILCANKTFKLFLLFLQTQNTLFMDNKISQQEQQDLKSESFLSQESEREKQEQFDLQEYAKDLFFTASVYPKYIDNKLTPTKKSHNDTVR